MDIYVLKSLMWLVIFYTLHAYASIKPVQFELTKEITNKGDRLQYIHL